MLRSEPVSELLPLFCLSTGQPRYYAETAVGNGRRSPTPVQLEFTPEWILRRGGRPWHHEQPPGRDQRGQIEGKTLSTSFLGGDKRCK